MQSKSITARKELHIDENMNETLDTHMMRSNAQNTRSRRPQSSERAQISMKFFRIESKEIKTTMKMENLHDQHSLFWLYVVCIMLMALCFFIEIFIFILHTTTLRWVMHHKLTLGMFRMRSFSLCVSLSESNSQTTKTPAMEAGYAQGAAPSENQPFPPTRTPTTEFSQLFFYSAAPCWLMSDEWWRCWLYETNSAI
jgi:hypothetical protein